MNEQFVGGRVDKLGIRGHSFIIKEEPAGELMVDISGGTRDGQSVAIKPINREERGKVKLALTQHNEADLRRASGNLTGRHSQTVALDNMVSEKVTDVNLPVVLQEHQQTEGGPFLGQIEFLHK